MNPSFICPHCQSPMEVPEGLVGQIVVCPLCNGQLEIPVASIEPAFSSRMPSISIREPRVRQPRRRTEWTPWVLIAGIGITAAILVLVATVVITQQPRGEAGEARRVVEAMLDRWISGDTFHEFVSSHPEMIRPIAFDWLLQEAHGTELLRYQIADHQQVGPKHTFSLSLVFLGPKMNTIVKSGTCEATQLGPSGDLKWSVILHYPSITLDELFAR